MWFIQWFWLFNKKSKKNILREIFKRTSCPCIVTLTLLLFFPEKRDISKIITFLKLKVSKQSLPFASYLYSSSTPLFYSLESLSIICFSLLYLWLSSRCYPMSLRCSVVSSVSCSLWHPPVLLFSCSLLPVPPVPQFSCSLLPVPPVPLFPTSCSLLPVPPVPPVPQFSCSSVIQPGPKTNRALA